MKIGVITDIHNNITALKAVANHFKRIKCDRIICCGDIIGIGPCPEETVKYMMKIPNLISVRGNHEKYLLEGMPDKYPNEENMSAEEMKHHQWEHSLLSAESAAFLENLPYRIDVSYEGFNITVIHYCMDREGHYNYKANPSEHDLKEMFADIQSDIILYGHNHCRNMCKVKKLYVNAGSLGCPAQDKNIARCAVLKIENGNAEAEPIDIEYNADDVVNLIDEIKYPDYENIKKYFYGIW